MSKILIAFPSNDLSNIFIENKDIFFIDTKGFWVYDVKQKERNLVKYDEIPIDNNLFSTNTRKDLNYWNPIWTRWVSNAHEYENLRIYSMDLIDKIKSILFYYKIDVVIFSTGVSHHIDSSILQICTKHLNIKQIFLYSIVFDSRLLPLVQYESIFDRKILKKNISNYKYSVLIEQFYQNRLIGNSPRTNTVVTSKKSNYIFALIKLFYSKTINLFFNTELNSFSIFKNYSLLDELKIINNQRIYLKKYKLNKYDYIKSTDLINSNDLNLVLTAHYQPEATSFPEGGNYSNHIEVVKKLRKLGYKKIIYYKEHMATNMYLDDIIGMTRVGLYRSLIYFNLLKSYKCEFLSDNIVLPFSDKIIYKYIPVTISGTIALERSLAGLHTIVCGLPWFIDMPGIIHIDNIHDITNLNNDWVVPNNNIALGARKFLLNKLDNNTLSNYIGIGTNTNFKSNNSLESFITEFTNLIT